MTHTWFMVVVAIGLSACYIVVAAVMTFKPNQVKLPPIAYGTHPNEAPDCTNISSNAYVVVWSCKNGARP